MKLGMNEVSTGGSLETSTEAEEEEQPVNDAEYDTVPVEDFGMGVLLVMGYEENSGLGATNKKQVDVYVAEIQSHRSGLDADWKVLEKINQLKQNLKRAGIDERDNLCMERGACVLIEEDSYTDLYGNIESIDEDVSGLTVALAIGGTDKWKEVISISQYDVKLASEKEFLKYQPETSDPLMKS